MSWCCPRYPNTLSRSYPSPARFRKEQHGAFLLSGEQRRKRSAAGDQPSALDEAQGPEWKGFRKLKVREKSHHLTVEVYKTTATFPRAELQGLTSEIRRAAVSIPTSVGEGWGGRGEAQLGPLVQIARGMAS